MLNFYRYLFYVYIFLFSSINYTLVFDIKQKKRQKETKNIEIHSNNTFGLSATESDVSDASNDKNSMNKWEFLQ